LTKTYPGMTAVDGVNLTVESGEFLTLLGPSGSGKTTTLMMIAGFTPPTSGDICLDGTSITSSPPEHRDIGVVFQSYALFPHMTVFENVAFPLRMRSSGKEEMRTRVNRTLEMVQLSGLGDRLPKQLSGGQQQRVALARAMVFDPRILLMDEPLGALDKKLREHMQFELKRLHKDLGTTIIYVTHDQEEALTMSDRIALMNNGHIEQLGSAEDLYNEPVNHFVADFIGESNLFSGTWVSEGEFVDEYGTRFRVNASSSQVKVGQECSLMLRPEDLIIRSGNTDGATGVTGKVTELLYVGDHIKYTVEARGGTNFSVKYAEPKNKDRATEGENVRIYWDPGNTRLIP
jgi:putative spermidine/putrescine transport system ATP-binding protein